MARVVFELSACVDCLMFVANGDIPEAAEGDPELPDLIAAHLGADHASKLVCGDGDGDSEFSWSACECCGSKLGGSRHALAVLSE